MERRHHPSAKALAGCDKNARVRPQKRQRHKDGSRADSAPLFDLLPHELVLSIFILLGNNLVALASIAQTCRRHHDLASDPALWRRLCESRFGPLVLHRQFAAYGKCWRWLYRARARAVAPMGDDVGAVLINIAGGDSIYWGDCRDGLPHGYGLALLLPAPYCQRDRTSARTHLEPADAATLSSRTGYEGEWRNGRRCGRGVHTFACGSRFTGSWVDDEIDGHGVFTFHDGASYMGGWKSDLPDGHGIFVYADGGRREGEWRSGKQDGCGTRVWPDGRRYDGQFECGKAHGRGVCVWPCGAKYDGEFKHGKPHGRGTMTWSDGHRYEGLSKKGRPHGHGTFTWPGDGHHEGEFKKGQRHGYGVRVYGNGDRYAGYWRDDDPHGHGTVTHANGARYVVHHTRDATGGRGTHVGAGDVRYDKQWTGGRAAQRVAFDFSDGSRMRGRWKRRGRLVETEVAHHADRDPSCRCRDSPCFACGAVDALRNWVDTQTHTTGN
ncbi:Morn repeat domain containing protein [Pandoravirus neocaledonia]|uniref:Morn repeat domain containing protein n=1 Tax=Pandoravirus neocaledonia TaxID=2107708 RepID=A0A2U7UDD2_9VIRU|nr:Morn repeat domain containing protein [Pandoravirus neocaledonia]AVK76365.1 Morn repeat domain containing protein [Pandoravirus neocaledonia]